MHFIRVPYSREFKKETRVYRKAAEELGRMRHVAPHVAETVALFAVLTRLERPQGNRLEGELARIAPDLTPIEKLWLYDESRPPERLDQEKARTLVRGIAELRDEHNRDARYEGRAGASVRDLRAALLRAAVRRESACVTPSAVEASRRCSGTMTQAPASVATWIVSSAGVPSGRLTRRVTATGGSGEIKLGS